MAHNPIQSSHNTREVLIGGLFNHMSRLEIFGVIQSRSSVIQVMDHVLHGAAVLRLATASVKVDPHIRRLHLWASFLGAEAFIYQRNNHQIQIDHKLPDMLILPKPLAGALRGCTDFLSPFAIRLNHSLEILLGAIGSLEVGWKFGPKSGSKCVR